MPQATHLTALATGASTKQSCAISASKTSGQVISKQNPLGVQAIIKRAVLHVKTGSSAACTLDIGTATTSTSNDGLIDGISVNAAADTIYDNVTNVGTNGKATRLVGATDYITASVASGNANGLVADLYVDLMPLTGGD